MELHRRGYGLLIDPISISDKGGFCVPSKTHSKLCHCLDKISQTGASEYSFEGI